MPVFDQRPVYSIESFAAVWKITTEWSFLSMRTMMKLQCVRCQKGFRTIHTKVVILAFAKTKQQSLVIQRELDNSIQYNGSIVFQIRLSIKLFF